MLLNKRALYIVTMITSTACFVLALPSKDSNPIVLEKDVGYVYLNGPKSNYALHAAFEYQNTSEHILRVKKIDKGCGCTQIKVENDNAEKDATIIFHMNVDVSRKNIQPGGILSEKSVVILERDNKQIVLALILKGTILWSGFPHHIEIGECTTKMGVVSQGFVIHPDKENKCCLVKVYSKNPEVACTMKKRLWSTVQTVQLEVDSRLLKKGKNRFSIVAEYKFSDGHKEQIESDVFITLLPEINYPESFSLGILKKGENIVSGIIELTAGSKTDGFVISDFSFKSGYFSCKKLSENDSRTALQITFSLPEDGQREKVYRDDLEIYPLHHNAITIPVYVYVQK